MGRWVPMAMMGNPERQRGNLVRQKGTLGRQRGSLDRTARQARRVRQMDNLGWRVHQLQGIVMVGERSIVAVGLQIAAGLRAAVSRNLGVPVVLGIPAAVGGRRLRQTVWHADHRLLAIPAAVVVELAGDLLPVGNHRHRPYTEC